MFDSQPASATSRTDALLVYHSSPGLDLQLPEIRLRQTTPLTIGRQASAHLVIDERSVSRRHAVISYINKQYMLQDLSSTNGTFVNNERVDLARPCVLRPNDILRFGNLVTCKFLLYPPNSGSQDSLSDNKSSTRRVNENTASLKFVGQEQPILNSDGSFSSPGREQPVSASGIATFKEVPALIVLPPSSDEVNTSPWVHLLKLGKLTTIGRGRGNAIELDDFLVSRRHAELFLTPDGCYIRDVGSSNGVIINQLRLTRPHRLSHGDRIKLGETLLFFLALQAGQEPTEKHPACDPSTEHHEQEGVATSRGMASPPPISSQQLGTSMPSPATGSTSPPLTNPSYTGTVQGSLTKRMAAVATPERRIAIVICPQCSIANTHVARFCASCSNPLPL